MRLKGESMFRKLIAIVAFIIFSSGQCAAFGSAYGQMSQQQSVVPATVTMQSAAVANGNGTTLTTTGYATAILSVTGSMSGGTTVNFEASIDGTTWVGINGASPAGTVLATNTTSIGDFVVNVAGYNNLRARIGAYSSGTVTVNGCLSVVSGSTSAVALPSLTSTGTLRTYLSEVNGAAVNVGTGASSTGTQRVAVSSDSSIMANAGTNLNTSALALESGGNLASLSNAQGSTTSGQKGPLVQGAVTTSAPTYSNAQTAPVSLTTSGEVRVSLSSSSVTANAGTNLNTSALALETGGNLATIAGGLVTQGSTTSGQKGGLELGAVTTSSPTYTNGQSSPITMTTAGAVRTDASATTQPVSGTVTSNAGTNLNTSALALETGGNLATIAGGVVSQGSTTSGQKGELTMGAVTTSSPTYTNAQSSPITMTTAGAVRTDASATTQPVSAASLPLPTGASTSAKQAALGTAGSASSDVITVQGVASMTPLVVSQVAGTVPSSTTLQSGATANGNGSTMTVTGYSTAMLHISSSVAGIFTINFEASTDGGTTWFPIIGRHESNGSMDVIRSISAGSAVDDGLWSISVAGYTSLRARISGYSSGTITVAGFLSAMAARPSSVQMQPKNVPTYSIVNTSFTIPATPTDMLYFSTGTPTTKILSIILYASQTTLASDDFILKITTTGPSGGTTAGGAVWCKHDSNDPGSAASLLWYTANPTTPAVGTVYSDAKIMVGSSAAGAATSGVTLFDANDLLKPITLHTGQGLVLNFAGAALPTGLNVRFLIKYTEE